MVSFLETWLVVGFLGLTLAVPLGPVNAEIIKQVLDKALTTKFSWLLALLTGIGAMTGDFIVAFSILTIGIEILEVIFLNPYIKIVLYLINTIILGFLGITALFRKQEPLLSQDDSSKDQVITYFEIQKVLKQYITGLSLVITSPWTYFWWFSVGTLMITYENPDLISRLIIVIMFLSGILLWNLFFSTSLSIVGQIPNPRFFQWITKGTAIILLFFAGIMIVEAWKTFIEIV